MGRNAIPEIERVARPAPELNSIRRTREIEPCFSPRRNAAPPPAVCRPHSGIIIRLRIAAMQLAKARFRVARIPTRRRQLSSRVRSQIATLLRKLRLARFPHKCVSSKHIPLVYFIRRRAHFTIIRLHSTSVLVHRGFIRLLYIRRRAAPVARSRRYYTRNRTTVN